MKKMKFYIPILVLLLITYTSCDGGGPNPEPPVGTDSISKSQEAIEFDTINFYFENSASIDGYLGGDDFLVTLHKIINNCFPEFHIFIYLVKLHNSI